MANIMDLSTEDKLEYHFFPVSSGSVQFKVRTPNDAHIALTMGPQESDPMIEIFLGGWGNTKSVIRRNRTKPDKVEMETPNILNGGEFRGFWVRWDGGIISAGREGEAIPFLAWTDPEPFPIAFVGVCTGWGATGTWKIEDGAEFNTPDQLEYKFGPVLAGSLKFEYRGPHNCHVALTPAPAEVDPMYEIMLGGWENTKSVIRHCRQKPDKVEVPTPGIMNPNEFRQFLIEWRSGRVMVRDGESGMVIMEWSDPAPFGITHFGVRTGWGARGEWRITHFNNAGAQPLSPVIMESVSPKTFRERLHWLPMVDGKLPPDAMIGGFENEHIYIARAYHNNSLCTGKYMKSAGKAFVPWGGREHCKEDFEILCGFNAKWIKTKSNCIPQNAFIGGRTGGAEVNNEPLYIGRAMYDGRLICGKAYARYNLCYLPFNGREIEISSYEILVTPDDEIQQALPFTT